MKDKKVYIIIAGFIGVILVSVVLLVGIVVVFLGGMKGRGEREVVGAEVVVKDLAVPELEGELVATVSLVGDILGKKDFFVDNRVAIGPVVVTNNDVDKKTFSVKESSGKDVYIEIDYSGLPAEEEWHKLEASKASVIYVKGIVRRGSNSSSVYIEADMVTLDQNKPLSETGSGEKEDDVQREEEVLAITKEQVTDTRYPQGNIQYVPYKNDRYDFSIAYPDIFEDKKLPDNGDGITLTNSQMGTVLLTYGYNNVNDETVKELYEEDLRNASTLLYKFQKDNWYVVSWEDGQEGYYKKAVVGEGSINVFILSYPKKYDPEYSPLVEHLFATFETPGVNTAH